MRKFLILLLVCFISAPAFAQWRRASIYGADVRALIVDPAEPDTFYLGTSSGEVYVSTDAAKSWTNPYGGTPFPGYVVDNLLVDRNGRLWTASWGLWGGGVIAVSSDHGKSWIRRDAGLEDFSVRAIALDSKDSSRIVVGGLTGVYRSDDDGSTWTKISDQVNVESLAIDPRNRDRIYVGTWRQGIRTDDGGKTWIPINDGMVLDTDMFSILIEPDNPDSLWISTCGWVYNSADRGGKWTRYRDGFDNRRIHDIEVDPCDPNQLYAGSVAGLYRSEDRGKTWYTVSSEDLVINSIAMSPQRPDRIVVGVEGDGVYVSNDGAKTFQRSSHGLYDVKITSIATDPSVRNRVYAAVVFGGASSGIYRSDDGGANWDRATTAALPPVLSLSIAPDHESENKFLAGTERGFFWSHDGSHWTQSAPVNAPLRVDKVLRFTATRAFAATSDGVYTTKDGGRSWYRLANAGTRTVDIVIGNLGEKRALYALTESGVTVFDGERWLAVANAPTKGRTLALRTLGGVQYLFVAGIEGATAGIITPDAQWEPAYAADAQFASVFGAAQTLFLTSRQQHEILVADPKDRDWLSLSLPTRNTEVTTIARDPFNAQRYYVGTLGEGVYIYEGRAQRYIRAEKTTAAIGAAPAGAQ